MRLTRKKAIELCIELWSWLAKTGKYKGEWPKWKKIEKKYGYIRHCCFFCEYHLKQLANHDEIGKCGSCKYCPIDNKFGLCSEKTYYVQWLDAKTPKTRKKYAKLFLKQIEQLR